MPCAPFTAISCILYLACNHLASSLSNSLQPLTYLLLFPCCASGSTFYNLPCLLLLLCGQQHHHSATLPTALSNGTPTAARFGTFILPSLPRASTDKIWNGPTATTLVVAGQADTTSLLQDYLPATGWDGLTDCQGSCLDRVAKRSPVVH